MDGSLKSQPFFGAKFEDVCTQLMVNWMLIGGLGPGAWDSERILLKGLATGTQTTNFTTS